MAEEVPAAVSEYMKTIGARGGSKKTKRPKGLAALSEDERSRIAAQGAKARWKNKKAAKKKAKG